ncbi:MAG: hypothetical protein PHW15_03495 [Patescibacteria group bacterium]|nr:hypothetical protein [Patescibacteria group bacterium]
MKTIDINCKEWFDKVNGNSYFSGTVTVDFGTPEEKSFTMPFQYGYGDQYIHEGFDTLLKNGLIPKEWLNCPSRYARENGVILRNFIQRNCKKRELM